MSPKIFYLLSFFLFALPNLSFGHSNSNPILIKAIQFKGLRNIQADQINAHLPLKIGQTFSEKDTTPIVQGLYASGFFDAINLSEEAGTIIFEVKERPVIKQITINQEAKLPDKVLDQLLEQLNIKVGEFFSESAFKAFEKELQGFYNMQGQYQNTIHTEHVLDKQKDQVSLKIHLPIQKEALRFADIYIVGNTAFTIKELLTCLPVTNNLWKGLLTNKILICHPSTQQMALEELKKFYQNKGYFEVEVKTQHTSIVPNQTAAYWVIEVKEGLLYHFGEYKVIGPHKLSQQALKELIHFTPKQIYSRDAITKIEKALKDKFGFFSKIEIVPSINQKDATIDLIISIDPGKKVYVRKLHIRGNQFVQEHTIRRLCQQQENAVFSTEAVKESEKRLNQAGFSKSPISILPTKISDDQVDLTVQIEEHDNPSQAKLVPGQISFGGKESTFSMSAAFGNLLGSGIKIDSNVNKIANDYFVSLLYDNPYVTLDGIHKTVKLVFRSHNPSILLSERMQKFLVKVNFRQQHSLVKDALDKAGTDPVEAIKVNNNTANTKFNTGELPEYNMNELSLMVNYGIPINRTNHLWTLNFQPKIFELRLPENLEAQSQELKSFIHDYGKYFLQARFATGGQISQIEGTNFPVKGFFNKLKLTFTSLWFKEGAWWPYVKLDANGAAFKNFKLSVKQEMNIGIRWKTGYGLSLKENNEALPFFENYHSGQLKGFALNSLGPKNSLGQQLGGNFMLNGSIMLCAPEPLRGDNFRVSAFCDIGAVEANTNFQQLSREFSPKLSVGVALDVLVPLPAFLGGTGMPLNISLAQPIWYKGEDQKQICSFNFGSSFI